MTDPLPTPGCTADGTVCDVPVRKPTCCAGHALRGC